LLFSNAAHLTQCQQNNNGRSQFQKSRKSEILMLLEREAPGLQLVSLSRCMCRFNVFVFKLQA
jgi:hypothetical protein